MKPEPFASRVSSSRAGIRSGPASARAAARRSPICFGQPATDSTEADTANTVPRRSTSGAAQRLERDHGRRLLLCALGQPVGVEGLELHGPPKERGEAQQPHDRDQVDAARPQARAPAPSPAGALHRFAPAATSRCERRVASSATICSGFG
jgi:hypothetical protein